MSSRDSNVVDMSKLTERELLIRLHDKVDNLETISKEVPLLRDRVTKIEVRSYTISSLIGSAAIAISLVFNYLKIK